MDETLERGEQVRPRPDPEEYKGEEPEDELEAELFQELRNIELSEGSVIFINVGRDTPLSVVRRTRDALSDLLDRMGYERVGVFVMTGEISVDAIKPTEDRKKWLGFLAESLTELHTQGYDVPRA